MAKKNISYSEAIDQIKEIIDKMENNEVNIDQLSENVKTVANLVSTCKNQLKQTENDIDNILKNIEKD